MDFVSFICNFNSRGVKYESNYSLPSWSVYFFLGTVLTTLRTWTCLILRTALWLQSYFPHFTHKKLGLRRVMKIAWGYRASGWLTWDLTLGLSVPGTDLPKAAFTPGEGGYLPLPWRPWGSSLFWLKNWESLESLLGLRSKGEAGAWGLTIFHLSLWQTTCWGFVFVCFHFGFQFFVFCFVFPLNFESKTHDQFVWKRFS